MPSLSREWNHTERPANSAVLAGGRKSKGLVFAFSPTTPLSTIVMA